MEYLQKTYAALKWMSLVLISFVALQAAILAGVFDPKPYWDVHARTIEISEARVDVVADFFKGDCDLVRFSVVGLGFEGVELLT